MNLTDVDLLVVGAGFFGVTIAERCANILGKKVLLIDKRDHIGGNAFSEVDPRTGIEIHRYGTHIFHTPNASVWNYLTAFTTFTEYRHRVFASSQGNIFPLPINLGTICQFFQRHLTPSEARLLVQSHASEITAAPKNLEQKAISLIGRPLYEAFIKGYTKKQWQTDPNELSESIITRLPVRFNFDSRYFSDAYEGMPTEGYTKIFEKMLSNPLINVQLNVDYFDLKPAIPKNVLTIFTGPIDRFFDFRAGALTWRTIDLELDRPALPDFQGTAVVNYSDEHVPFTRIHEYRHLHPERPYQTESTIIAREFSRFAGRADEPYYPVDTLEDKKIYAAYARLADEIPDVIFGGRLGSYKYLDMHQAIAAGLKAFDMKVAPRLTGDHSIAVVN